MKTTKETILHTLHLLKPELQKEGIAELGLFGSFAVDRQTLYSDIDIAIRKSPDFMLARSVYDYFTLISDIKSRLGKKLHRNIDIFDLDSDSPFRKHIEEELIYV